MTPANDRPLIVRALLRWYRSNGRKLPWRTTRNPYRILLSEVMLQQTQVARVLEKYPLFLGRFPTFRTLALARQRDVVLAWRGMGYNNRAVRLHRLAGMITSRYGGRLPRDHATLLSLPGIGEYTAAAIRASAFREPVAVVDVNVRRVLSRISRRMPSVVSVRPEPEIRKLAGELLPVQRAYDWNQALMDLGATVCTARAPRCTACPVARWCPSMNGMTRGTVRMARPEPSRGGIPNRIYRGRIVDLLRHSAHAAGVTAAAIGQAVCPGFSRRDAAWLSTLLGALHRDGLIEIRSTGRIALR